MFEKYKNELRIHSANFGTLLLFCICFSVSAKSQTNILKEKISISAKNESLSSVLNQISKKYNCFFSYDASVINGNQIINLKINKLNTDSVLRIIFPDTSLKFQAVEKHIIIYRQKFRTENQIKNFQNQILKIQGIVADCESHEPLPYAAVGIAGTNLGTVSNVAGTFILKISNNFIDSTVCISNIGYSDFRIAVKDLVKNPEIIYLKRTYIPIQEIIIRNNDPVLLLKSALNRKSETYLNIPSVITGFYREGIEKGNERISCSEAVIEIYKNPYSYEFSDDQIKVIQSRKFINPDTDDSVTVKLKAGPSSALLLDFMTNNIDFLSNDNFEKYQYKTVDIETYNEKSAYVIEFEQKENYDEASYKGRMYLSTENLGIIGAEFEVNTEKSRKNIGNFVIKKKLNLQTNVRSAKYSVSFKQCNNRLLINHVRGDIELRIKKRKTLFAADYNIYFELTGFDVDTKSVKKFNRDEILKKNTIFIDGNYRFDPDFWGDYNYISPEESPDEILEKLSSELKKNNK
jgi:hypothetical protein